MLIYVKIIIYIIYMLIYVKIIIYIYNIKSLHDIIVIFIYTYFI